MGRTLRSIPILLILLLVGCQPYPDHGEAIPDFRAHSIDFGHPRELKLLKWAGDDKSLTLEFNQPINRLDEKDAPIPFELDFRPRIPLKNVVRQGTATVRVEFAQTLPPAHSYTAIVPKGWRALTGASFLRPHRVQWDTERPTLTEVQGVPGKASWYLVFNQPIEPEALESVFEVPGLNPEDYDLLPLDPTRYELKILTPVAVGGALKIKAGLKSKTGPLEGVEHEVPLSTDAGFFLCEKSEWRPEVGAVFFTFSEEVTREELFRNLRGLEHARPELYTSDRKNYRLFLRDVSSSRHLILSDTLTSVEGARLLQDISIVADPPRRTIPQRSFRKYRSLKAAQTVLNVKTPEKATVSTWRLKRDQAVGMMNLSEKDWKSARKLPVELSKPVYSHKTAKARGRTRFLETGSSPGGLFLVRITHRDKVRRYFVGRSAIHLEGWSLNGQIHGFAGKLSGIPLSDVPVVLCDDRGELVERVMSAADGQVSFSDQKHRGAFLWLEGSEGTSLVPLAYDQVSPPVSVPGLLWTHGQFFLPGGENHYLGVWWSKEQLPLVEVVDSAGGLVDVSLTPPTVVGPFFQGRFSSPSETGEYRLRFRQGTGSHEGALVRSAIFEVSRLAAEDGAGDAELEFTDASGPGHGGTYRWNGRGAALLGLRARLVAPDIRADGWEKVRPGVSDMVPLQIEQKVTMSGGNFSIKKLPRFSGRWDLVVEMFDRESPGTVVRRIVSELGKEEVVLQQSALKSLSYSTTLARFRFRYQAFERNGRRALFCRFKSRAEYDWTTIKAGEATFSNGSYEWDVSFPSRGTYRIEVMGEADGEPIAVWQRNLRDTGQASEQLAITPTRVSTGQRFSVGWPELPEGTPVWLSLLTGAGQQTQRRYADQDGGLGEMTVPSLKMGQAELEVVLAILGSERRLQTETLEVNDSQFYTVLQDELIDFPNESLALPSQKLTVEIPAPCQFGLIWWAHADSRMVATNALATAARYVREGQELGNLPHWGPMSLERLGEMEVVAPAKPGEYSLKMLAVSPDGGLLVCSQSVEVEGISRWSAVTPDWLRPGDRFAAGVRFWSDKEELAPTGATTSVELDSTLLPLSYQTTAALVDPGAVGDMLFSYRAPEYATNSEASKIRLVWDLGVEGESHRVQAELNPLPSEQIDESFRVVTLRPAHDVRVNIPLSGRWMLRATVEGEPAAFRLQSSQGSTRNSDVSKELPFEMTGSGSDILELSHLSGPEVRLEVFQLKPTDQVDRYSAEDFYLMRHLETVDGTRIERDDLKTGESYLLAHYLVAPESGKSGQLLVPLPGGTRVNGVWMRTATQLTALPWNLGKGLVEAELPELTAGEHQIIVLVEAHVGGDYFWPASRVIESEGLAASTVSGRVVIDWE